MLAERFGDVEMSEAFRKINDEHAALSDATKGMKEAAKLEKQKDGAIEDLAATRDRFRGLYNVPQTASAKRLGRISAAVRNANVPLSLGMAAVSSLPDAAGAMFRWGMMSSALRRLGAVREVSHVEPRARQGGTAAVQGDGHRHRYDHGAAAPRVRRHNGDLQAEFAARAHPAVGGRQVQFGEPARALDRHGEVHQFNSRGDRASAGGRGQRERNRDRQAGARPRGGEHHPAVAERIAEQYRVSGTLIDGVLLPNTQAWTDAAARTAFEGALAREANIAVVTPGLDKPLFFNDPVLPCWRSSRASRRPLIPAF
jgi:hypothetical protein